MEEFRGKAAIVTGASRGIGAATARELARNGVSVLLAARTAGEIETIAGEIREAGGQAEALTCDVSRYADLEAAVAPFQAAVGSLAILGNNSGVI